MIPRIFQPLKASYFCALVLSLLLLAGCTCNGNQQDQQTKDSLDSLKADSLAREGQMTNQQFTFDSLTTHWLSDALGGRNVDTMDFVSAQAPGQTVDSSSEATSAASAFKDSLAFQPDQQFYSDYATVLRWSPDSSYLLDFGSYGQIPVKGKEGRTSLEGGEPDTKIMVATPAAHKQWLVMFAGPGTSILDAKWKNDRQFMLLYAFEQDNNHSDTTLLIGDMTTKTLHWYHLNDQ